VPGRWPREHPRSIQAAGLLAGLVVWEIYGHVWGSGLTVPPFSQVLAAAPEVLSSSEFWAALGATSGAALLGLAIVLPVGYALGVLAGVSRLGGRFLQPYMTVGLAAPMIAVIPVIVMLFGLGLGARLATVVAFSLPYMVVNVAAGYRSAPADLVDMARAFGVSRGRIFTRVRTMSAMPAIFGGLRLAVARAWVGVIIAELLILATGLGRLLARSSQSFQTEDMYVIILAILIAAALTLRLVGFLETRVLVGKGIVRK
jgi:ABC-type nitrate/sulfonate/bicarbonate transport system permease component